MSHFGDYLEGVYDRYKVLADDKLNISPSSEFINLKAYLSVMKDLVSISMVLGYQKGVLCW